MPFIIDGHNLIAQVPGLDLSDPDDEMQLIEILQQYGRLHRKGKIECYFDNAPFREGQYLQRFGQVQVYFVRQGSTADAAIEKRLAQLGKEARNWQVVSSDRRVQQAARAAGAKAVSSESFVQELRKVISTKGSRTKDADDAGKLDEDEIRFWLDRFQYRK